MNSNFRNVAIWVVIALLLFALLNLFQNPARSNRGSEISYSEFKEQVKAGNIKEVVVQAHRYSGQSNDKTFSTLGPDNQSEVIKELEALNVKIRVRPADEDVPTIFNVLV